MGFATLMTQILARFTDKLDSRHNVPMNPRTYTYAISKSLPLRMQLIRGNQSSHCAYRSHVQYESYLRKPVVFVSLRVFYSDAQGES